MTNERVTRLAFWAWLSLISFPMVWAYRDRNELLSDSMSRYQIIGFSEFFLIMTVFGSREMIQNFGSLTFLYWTLPSILILLTPLQLYGSTDEIGTGLLHCFVLLASIFSLSALWRRDDQDLRQLFNGAALILFLFIVISILVLGGPVDRWVGGIHPNLYGAALLACVIFSLFSTSRLMYIVRLGCLGVSVWVSSRYALIGSVLSLGIYFASCHRLSPRVLVVLAIAGAGVTLLLDQISEILALNDEQRGINSGLTGRTDEWEFAVKEIFDVYWGLGYKRAPLFESGHNGYLKTLLEFGVLGGSLIIFFVISIVASKVVFLLRSRVGEPRRIQAAQIAGCLALLLASFFQPQLFNTGDPMGLTFLILMFSQNRGGLKVLAETRSGRRFLVRRTGLRGLSRLSEPKQGFK